MNTMNVLDLPYREAALWLWMREVGGSHGMSTLTQITGLGRLTVRQLLISLESQGLVEFLGNGRSRLYRATKSPTHHRSTPTPLSFAPSQDAPKRTTPHTSARHHRSSRNGSNTAASAATTSTANYRRSANLTCSNFGGACGGREMP